MRFATVNSLPLCELQAMAQGAIPDTITDMDFLETLAAHRCFVVPPFILQSGPNGGLRQMVRLIYSGDGQLDRPRMLLLLARKLRGSRWGRLSAE